MTRNDSNRKNNSLVAECVFTLRMLIGVFSLLLLIASFTITLSTSADVLIISQFLFTFCVIAPLPRSNSSSKKVFGLVGMLLFVLTLISGTQKEVAFPIKGTLSRVGSDQPITSGEIISERDLVFLATRILPFMGGLSLTESSGLLHSIYESYQSMEAQRGLYTSPLFQSLIWMPYLSDSQLLSFKPLKTENPERAIVFLHGVGGNWSLMCWIVSQAGQSIGASTYCPSLGVLGRWGSIRGKSIIRELLSSLEAQGKTEVYLMAMSAGAVGASQIAHEYKHKLHAVALFCGSHPIIRNVQLPILFLYGDADERFPPKILAWIARSSAKDNPSVIIEEVSGGHFLPIKQKDTFIAIVSDWLQNVTRAKRNSEDSVSDSLLSRSG